MRGYNPIPQDSHQGILGWDHTRHPTLVGGGCALLAAAAATADGPQTGLELGSGPLHLHAGGRRGARSLQRSPHPRIWFPCLLVGRPAPSLRLAWPGRFRRSARRALTNGTPAGGSLSSSWVWVPLSPVSVLCSPPVLVRSPPLSNLAGAMDDPTPEGEAVFVRPEASAGLSYTFLGTSKTENGIPTYSMLRAGTTIYAVGDNVLVNCGNLENPWIAKILLFYRDPSGNMCVLGVAEGGGWAVRGWGQVGKPMSWYGWERP